MTPELLARLREAQSAKRPVALLTRLSDGEQRLWPDDAAPGPLAEAAEAALREDETAHRRARGERWFVHPHNPPVRLIVVGAVHVAQALVPMAVTLGFAVTVVDPRRAFATPERFPGVSLSFDWPDEAMAALAPDGRTAVVTLTHDPKLDDPALDVALRSPCFYIGALGSRRTHAKRVARLQELGHDERRDRAHPRARRPRHRGGDGARDRFVGARRGGGGAARFGPGAARTNAPAAMAAARMIFGPTPLSEARGAVLAHTVRLDRRVLKKGTVLEAAEIAALQEDGHASVIAARLEPGDVPENEAADRLAQALMAPLLTRSRASTGRVNLFAETAGLLVVNADAVDRLNRLDESLTLGDACRASCRCAAREMVATIKVIPFAVPGAVLEVADGAGAAGTAPARPASLPAAQGRARADGAARPQGEGDGGHGRGDARARGGALRHHAAAGALPPRDAGRSPTRSPASGGRARRCCWSRAPRRSWTGATWARPGSSAPAA